MNNFKINIVKPAIGCIPIEELFIIFSLNSRYSMVRLKDFKGWIDTIYDSNDNGCEEAYEAERKLEKVFGELFYEYKNE